MTVEAIKDGLSRRQLFKGAAAGAMATGLVGGGATLASAKAPLTAKQIPGFYRRKVGSIEVTALLDGYLAFDQATLLALIAKATPEAMKPLNDKYFVPASGKITMPINAYVINTGDKVVLVDTGTADKFGPSAGALPAALAAAGFETSAIDIVALTHAHPDHAAGLVDGKGAAVYANAELVMAEAEMKFWSDAGTLARLPQSQQGFVDMALAAFKPYAARTRLIGNGVEVTPGVSSLTLPGHTPGHMGYRIASGSDQLLIVGDAIALYEYLFDKPDWSLAFDVDGVAAVATRKRLLDMASADRMMLAGMHMPFPGFGNVGREGSAYRYVPAPWSAL